MSASLRPVAYSMACEAPCDLGCVMRELYLFRPAAPRAHMDREQQGGSVSTSGRAERAVGGSAAAPHKRTNAAVWLSVGAARHIAPHGGMLVGWGRQHMRRWGDGFTLLIRSSLQA
eukprot:364568-Chlamydomonas_euryale.AAC.1